jgi:hypothetical protein
VVLATVAGADERRTGVRIDVGGHDHPRRVSRIQRHPAGVVRLPRRQAAPTERQLVDSPSPVVAGVAVLVDGWVPVGAADREDDDRLAVGVGLDIERPGPLPGHREVDRGERLRRRRVVVTEIVVDDRAVGRQQPVTVDDAVVDGRHCGVGVLLRGEHVDRARATCGVADIGAPGPGEQAADIAPRGAVVQRLQHVGIPPVGAREREQAVAGRDDVRVRHLVTQPELLLGLPVELAWGRRDTPSQEVISAVRRVHRDVPAVRTHVQRRRVVVVTIESRVQHVAVDRRCRVVVRNDFDVAVARGAAGPGPVGDGSHEEPAELVDHGALVLEPAPRAVVVEHDGSRWSGCSVCAVGARRHGLRGGEKEERGGAARG